MDVCKYIIHLQLPRPSTRFLFGCFHAHAGDEGTLSTATMQAWEQRGVWLHDDAHNALSLAALPPLRADIPLRALLPMHGDRRTTAGREPLLSVYNVQHTFRPPAPLGSPDQSGLADRCTVHARASSRPTHSQAR